jgi:hypothetical protein
LLSGGSFCLIFLFVFFQRWRLELFGFCVSCTYILDPPVHALLHHPFLLTLLSFWIVETSLLPKQPPLPNLKRLQHPLPPHPRPLNQTPLLPMLQIHTPSLISLARHMRHIDRNENISLLPLKPNQREQDGDEIRLVGAALLFGTGWGGC